MYTHSNEVERWRGAGDVAGAGKQVFVEEKGQSKCVYDNEVRSIEK